MAQTTNDKYRAFCKRLKALGVKQTTLADHVGHGPSWVSEWLRSTGDKYDPKTKGTDALDKYFDQLADLLAQRPKPKQAREGPHLERKPA